MSAQGSRLTPERPVLEGMPPSAGRLWKIGYVAVTVRTGGSNPIKSGPLNLASDLGQSVSVTGPGYRHRMDTVWAILWGLVFLALTVGWLAGLGGGRRSNSDFDTKDPGEDLY